MHARTIVRSAYQGCRASSQCTSSDRRLHLPHTPQVTCGTVDLDQLTHRVQRRQVLKTTSLGLLASWLPFSNMAAKAEFHPEEKWWRSDTVAVVTGGALS